MRHASCKPSSLPTEQPSMCFEGSLPGPDSLQEAAECQRNGSLLVYYEGMEGHEGFDIRQSYRDNGPALSRMKWDS